MGDIIVENKQLVETALTVIAKNAVQIVKLEAAVQQLLIENQELKNQASD